MTADDKGKRRELPTADDLLAMELPPLKWLIPKLLPEGLAMLVGRPKVGKSWMALGFAIAIAQGTLILGKIKVPHKHACLYYALEDSKRRLQSRMITLGAAHPALPNFYWELDMPALHAGGAEFLGRTLDDYKDVGLVVIDMYGRITPTVQRDSRLHTSDVKALSPLQRMAQDRGVCILLLHHETKHQEEDSHFVQAVSGSYGVGGTVDEILVLRGRKRSDAVLHITGRDVEEQALPLSFSEGIWTLSCELAIERPTAGREQEVLELLLDHPGKKPSEIAAGLNISSGHARRLVFELSRKGMLHKTKDGLYYPSVTL